MVHISMPIGFVMFVVLVIAIYLLFEEDSRLDETPALFASVLINICVAIVYISVGYYWNTWKW